MFPPATAILACCPACVYLGIFANNMDLCQPGLRIYNFSMLNSVEHELNHAHNDKISTIFDILTFISMINTTYEIL